MKITRKASGAKTPDLFQVELCIPDENTVDFGNASAFVTCIAQPLKLAVKLCSLPDHAESQLNEGSSNFDVG